MAEDMGIGDDRGVLRGEDEGGLSRFDTLLR
jgi:hypothetical protein